ncbi:DUF1403 family protein, partial [Methylocystis sp.]
VEPQILNSTVHHSGVFSIQMYTRKSAAFRNALKFNRPISQFLMCPDTQWAKVGGVQHDAASAHFFAAGASLARLDQLLRCPGGDISRAGIGSADVSRADGRAADASSPGKNFGEGGLEPVFAGALRQRLALRAATACAAIARLREDEGALRDAEHLAGFDAAPTPGGRLHRLWRLFTTPSVRLDARVVRVAADCLDLPPAIDCEALAALVDERSTAENPLNAAARVSALALGVIGDAAQFDAEIFALWFADLVLARRLAWQAPLPLLATTITHPSMRTATGRRPRPSDADWDLSAARAMARAAQESYALATELSRRSNILLSVAPKLRAKKAARVVDLLLADDCVSPTRAATSAGLSDRATRRLFDRLMALGAVRELSGRANFRLYGL